MSTTPSPRHPPEYESVEVGDEVIVPVGADNNELTGKAIKFKADEGDGVKEFQMDEQKFLEIKDSSNIDVLDENLYCYDSAVFALTPAIQNRTSEGLLRKVKQFIDSVPAAQKSRDMMQP